MGIAARFSGDDAQAEALAGIISGGLQTAIIEDESLRAGALNVNITIIRIFCGVSEQLCGVLGVEGQVCIGHALYVTLQRRWIKRPCARFCLTDRFERESAQLAFRQIPAGFQFQGLLEVGIGACDIACILFGNRAIVIGREQVMRFEFDGPVQR